MIKREQILALAGEPRFQVFGTPAFSEHQVVLAAQSAIQHYKDSLAEKAGEPVAYFGFDKSIDFYKNAEQNFKVGDDFYTADAIAAAVKPLEEEIERLKAQLENKR